MKNKFKLEFSIRKSSEDISRIFKSMKCNLSLGLATPLRNSKLKFASFGSTKYLKVNEFRLGTINFS